MFGRECLGVVVQPIEDRGVPGRQKRRRAAGEAGPPVLEGGRGSVRATKAKGRDAVE
jgi:hypothetical protein